MKAKNLIVELKKKLRIKKDNQLAPLLGKKQSSLAILKKQPSKLTEKQVANLIVAGRKSATGEAQKYAVEPLFEYFPVDQTLSTHAKKWEILDLKIEKNKIIKEILEKGHGIYIFYNSQCKAIYVGKAKKLNLWAEMKGAYNRTRDAQEVWQVSHPKINVRFNADKEHRRKIRKKKVFLHDIANYFSAYQMEGDLIDNVEAMLIRAFANELTNTRMETFHKKPVKKRAKSKKKK